MVIVDFQELAHLAHPARNDAGEQHYYRMLHPGYYDSCNSFESEALFTHCHLVLARDAHTYTISMLMGALVEHILATFLVEVDPNQIEFRFSDRDGETLFKLPEINDFSNFSTMNSQCGAASSKESFVMSPQERT